MAHDGRLARLERKIRDEFELLLASDAFGSWKGNESVRSGDLIAVNNSFLFRENKSTTKSALYMAIEASGTTDYEFPPVVVGVPGRINLQFKRLTSRELSKYTVTTLTQALIDGLPDLGSIIFCLVGRVGEPETAEVSLPPAAGVPSLCFNPELSHPAEIQDGSISLRNLADLDATWTAVKAAIAGTAIDEVALSDHFETGFHNLQEAAGRSVDPTDITTTGTSILSHVVETFDRQSEVFATLLEQHRVRPNDNDIYNELLRIAYNFADGTRTFLGLMYGICDLKPIVSWLTVYEQVDLAFWFSRLPFSLVGKAKPSLERYRSVIANARNQAFHDIFAFDHPFFVKLGPDALLDPELRLFREYKSRSDPALVYRDRQLVELFESLTRTARQPVPLGFWDGNRHVMACVVEVARALREALITLAG
jgi:hypothetical protein